MASESTNELETRFAAFALAPERTQLVAIARRVLKDQHEAEDVVQETLAAVWKRLPDITPNKLSHYVYRAVRQNARKRRLRLREQAAGGDDCATRLTPDRSSTFDPIELDDALATLPLPQRNVVRMKYYFGMTFKQIGESLSISTHTAASRCRYALTKLRNLFLS